MTSNYQKLAKIASRESKMILGLMSGTSMDGLDLALCHIAGHGTKTDLEIVEFHTIPHTENYKEKIRTVFAKGEANASSLTYLNQLVAEVSALRIKESLDQWKLTADELDLIASHGQTVYHNPEAQPFADLPSRPVTLQLGDGDFIAAQTGIVTISDFRQKHIARGGEGAPLALYGDFLLFSDPGESRILLNIGGIANFTFLPGAHATKPLLSTDTGPGNTIMDAFMQKHFGQPYDRDGRISRSGQLDQALLHALMNDPFFDQSLPRTTGPELFNLDYLDRKMANIHRPDISNDDIMATLLVFTTQSIVAAIQPFLELPTSVYISGGGIHNPIVMEHLRTSLSEYPVNSTKDLGVDPDAKEAAIFALLANECLVGRPDLYPTLGTASPKTSMGKISFP